MSIRPERGSATPRRARGPWRRVLAIVAVGLLPQLPRTAGAQAVPGARVAGDSARVLSAGGRSTLVVPLVNTADTAVTFSVQVDVPAGWRASDLSGSTTVPAHGRVLRFVTLSVNRHVPAADVRIPYSVLAGARPVRRDTVRFVVTERRALSITAAAPRYAVAGSSYVSRFVVRNEGNARREFRASVAANLAAAIDGATERTLDAGREDTINVIVRVPARGASHPFSSVTVRLQPAVVDTAEHLSAFTETSVFAVGGEEPWVTMPVSLTTRVGNQGPTMLFEGGGALGQPGSRLDFLMRGPRRETTIDGTSDEYRLSLQTPRWGLRLGDQPVRLSPLTEYGRIATGGSVRLGDSLLSLTMGGVRTRAIGETIHLQETFGQVGIRLPGSVQASVTGLARAGRPADSGKVGSVQLAWSHARTQRADVELARSLSGGSAVRGRLDKSGGRLDLNATALLADTAFPGYSRGSRIVEGSMKLAMSRMLWLRTGGEDRRTARGLLFDGGENPDTLVMHEPLREHRYQGAYTTLGVGRMLRFDGRWKRREDPLGAMPWGSERTAGVSLTVGGRALQLSPRIELGQSFNAKTVDGAPLKRAAVDARVGLGRWGSVTESFGFDAGQSMYDTVQARSWRSGTWLDAQLGHSHLTLGAQFGLLSMSNAWAAPVMSRRLDASLLQALPTGHELSARLRWDPQASALLGGATRVELGVRVPLRVPVARPQSSGWIRGRVDEEATGQGAPGVLLRLGDQLAMTDDKGEFQFARVTEGTHVLDVDLSTVAAGHLLRDSSVRTVKTVNGRRADVRMSLVRGGTVAGRVLWFDAASPASLDSAALARAPVAVLRGGAPRIEVLLQNGARKLSTVTNANGDFSTEGLEPGTWQVSINPRDVPATHTTSATTVAEIRGGERSTVELQLVPRRRTIHVLDVRTANPGVAMDSTRRPAPHARPAAKPALTREPAPAPAPAAKACPWPVVRPNSAICREPDRDSLPLPPSRIFPPV